MTHARNSSRSIVPSPSASASSLSCGDGGGGGYVGGRGGATAGQRLRILKFYLLHHHVVQPFSAAEHPEPLQHVDELILQVNTAVSIQVAVKFVGGA